ncbi:hypothetical protein BFJ72_g13961 [Fusarium proliferatum]|uniref:Phosphoinositide phospholipase C n=1 Tax=Gibberella intermedia TaxID=948311 RepID=A0A420S963_GIBIN|nr:hypothetical protein BFJ72_g13961 [Fusarium proliferatum]
MSEMMDHLHKAHPDNKEDISSIISSSAQTRMGIRSCPLCEVNGEPDSPELIEHVLEHVHDFSLRSLPWAKPSEVDIGGEVGSFNPERDGAVAITQWLELYEHEAEDIDPTLELSTCDYGRLAIITEQIASRRQDKLGLDIGFADEHGDESAEAETDISELTQDTLESIKEARDVVLCHECSLRWYRDEDGMQCPKCQSEFVDIVDPESGSEGSDLLGTVTRPGFATIASHGGHGDESRHSSDATASKPSARESTSGFRRFTDRLFSRKKADNIESRPGQDPPRNLVQFLGLKQSAVANQEAWKILSNVYYRQLESPSRTRSMFANFIRDVQHEDIRSTHTLVSDLDSFLQVMVGFYLSPLKPLPPKDLSKPISNYFINTTHRTMLRTSSGPHTTADAIREVLQFGHRVINLNVWNGAWEELKPERTTKTINRLFGLNRATDALKPVAPKTSLSESAPLRSSSEPIVKDGSLMPCGFREACRVIKKSAFVNTDLPVIIHLTVYVDHDHQDTLAQIMKEEWRDSLIDEPVEGCDLRFRLPKLEDLRGRILVSLTRYFPAKDDNALHDNRNQKPLPIVIVGRLNELDVYMRRLRFHGFDSLNTEEPTSVCSLQEAEVEKIISTSSTYLFLRNQQYLFYVNPNSARQESSNLDPLRFWRHGVQMAAISGHNVDEGMMLNEGMFADESGWVLKPVGYQSHSNNISTDLEAAPRKELDLSIFVFRDQEFLARTHREIKDLSSFMRASLHVDDEVNTWVSGGDFPISTDDGSGALGYEINFHVAKANPSIFPKLSILR